MKKITLLFVLLAFVCIKPYASEASLFSVNEAAISAEFDGLTQLDNYLSENPSTTMNDVVTTGNLNLVSVKLSSNMSGDGFTLNDMDWGAFAWGFCCCPVGFFVVAINKDKSQNAKASFWIGFGVHLVAILISSATTPSVYKY